MGRPAPAPAPPPGRVPAPALTPTGPRRGPLEPPGPRPVVSGLGRRATPGGGGIGLPDNEVGGRRPGGAGTGRPERAIGAPSTAAAAGAAGVGAGAGADASAAATAGAVGRTGAAGAGRGATGAGATGAGATGRGGCSLPLEVTTRLGGAGGGVGSATAAGGSTTGTEATASTSGSGAAAATADAAGVSTGAVAAGAAGSSEVGGAAAAFLVALAAFLTGFLSGSGGCTSRTRPSRSALRRTRSAWASTTLDECDLTPMPRDSQRSSVSLLVSPSSRASSYTRMFPAKSGFSPFSVPLTGAPRAAHRGNRISKSVVRRQSEGSYPRAPGRVARSAVVATKPQRCRRRPVRRRQRQTR
jgi:hypothetical protein